MVQMLCETSVTEAKVELKLNEGRLSDGRHGWVCEVREGMMKKTRNHSYIWQGED